MSLGGVEAIMRAMFTHRNHSLMQTKACSAIGNLALTDGKSCLFFKMFFSP